jgi:lysozyme family protein
MNVDTLISGIIQREGPTYTNDPSDAGGPTKYGITQATARANGYTGDMQNLTEDQARAIYKNVYWLRPKFDQLALIDEALAEKLLDIGVNRGPVVGVQYLQRALNVFNYNGSPYADLVVDGALGSATFGALKAFYTQRGAAGKTVLYQLVQALQAVGYVQIAEGNKTQEKYIYGWLTQRAFGV